MRDLGSREAGLLEPQDRGFATPNLASSEDRERRLNVGTRPCQHRTLPGHGYRRLGWDWRLLRRTCHELPRPRGVLPNVRGEDLVDGFLVGARLSRQPLERVDAA